MIEKKLPASLTHTLKSSGKIKRIIPDDQPLVFAAGSFATIMLGGKPGWASKVGNDRVEWLSRQLIRAADFYYSVAHFSAGIGRRGRPMNMADIAFIYAMVDPIKWAFGEKYVKYRNYDYRKGVEKQTVFQRVCNAWMDHIDPGHVLKPAAFKAAQQKRAKIEKQRR